MKSMQDRFFEKVEPITESGCWIWMASLNIYGYGRFRYKGRPSSAHRASWEMKYGYIPDGMNVCHKCDIPSCVNPNHLFIGTRKDNMRDKVIKGRAKTGKQNGENNGFSKLTLKQVTEIRNLYSTKTKTQKE